MFTQIEGEKSPVLEGIVNLRACHHLLPSFFSINYKFTLIKGQDVFRMN